MTKYTCFVCSYTTFNHSHFQSHELKQHKSCNSTLTKDLHKRTLKRQKTNFICFVCDRKFHTSEELDLHTSKNTRLGVSTCTGSTSHWKNSRQSIIPSCKLMCMICMNRFEDRGDYRFHVQQHQQKQRKSNIRCKRCKLSFKRQSSLEVHYNLTHRCHFCGFESSNNYRLTEHKLSHRHDSHNGPQQGFGKIQKSIIHPFKEISAFKGYAKTYRHRVGLHKSMPSLNHYYARYERKIREILRHYVANKKSIKLQITVLCEFVREYAFYDDIEVEECNHYINSNMRVILNDYYIKRVMKDIMLQIRDQIDLFEKNGSGWKLNKIMGCDIRLARFHLFKGGCYIPVPEKFRKKRAIVSPRNQDSECFIWAFLILMHYDEVKPTNRGRINQYTKFKSSYNFLGMTFPSSIRDAKKFEKQNSDKNFALNVFGLDSRKELNIKYQSIFCRDKCRKVINLLYVQKKHDGPAHWMAITAINRLLGSHNCHKRVPCYNCFNTFPNQEKLNEHEKLCFKFSAQKVEMPEIPETGMPTVAFQNYDRKLKTRYVIYADFEALCKDTSRIGPGNSEILCDHVPSGFALVVVDSYKKKDKIILKVVYRKEDCMEKFIQELDRISANLIDSNYYQKPMKPLSKQQTRKFNNAKTCHICEKPIISSDRKVKDHCHVTGQFRGAAHLQCNASYVQYVKIPVVMHNFKNYDCSLLLSSVKKFSEDYVDVLPQSSEKFLSIITQKFYFVDSCMHLSASLDQLTKNLNTDGLPIKKFYKRFTYLVQIFGKKMAIKMSRKGVYPYEYMNSWIKFDEVIFPPISEFYSTLSSSTVSQEDYDYGKSIFAKHCSNLGDYHDLYLLTDTLLLASVFENFRKVGLRHYRLDPVRYFSLAGYAWDSALYFSKEELDLITDQNMYNLIETGMRGGVSMISQRYAKANNKYMTEYNPQKPSKYLFFIDKNSLYGEALMQYLPVNSFEWESESEFQNFTKERILSWEDDSPIGRILCVDLEYPKYLHRTTSHSEYPLAPEKISIPKEQLSKYQRKLITGYGIKYSDKTKKLVPHLGSRTSYVVHYRNLKYYLMKGMLLKKIHYSVTFNQKPWLRDFIKLNASLRRKAKNDFEAFLFKTVINSTFGKSAQQVRKKENVKIVSSLPRFQYLSKQSNFKRFEILHPELVIVFRNMAKVTLNKPIYTAFTVLELSKLFIYDWHYDKIKSWYGDKAKFLVTDTDSLCYCIETKDLYKDLKRHQDEFDFSDYKNNHLLYSETNKKVIGKMKDEAKGNIIYSFVGLAPKMYSMEGSLMRKYAARGVKRAVAERLLCHQKFKNVLFKQQKLFCHANQIRSKNHKLFTANFAKVAMHCFDSKRFILKDGITSLPHNHYKLLKN